MEFDINHKFEWTVYSFNWF